MNTYAVDIQAVAALEYKDETFFVNVDAPQGFDQAVRRAIRHSVARAGEWNELHPDATTSRSEDKGAYRVVSVRINAPGFRSAYAVEVQAAVGFEFVDEMFTVTVDAPEGFDQAVRRAIRTSVARASEWNAENPDSIASRLEDADAYRVVAVRVNVDR